MKSVRLLNANRFQYCILICLAFFTHLAFGQSTSSEPFEKNKKLNNQISFIENKGQVGDQNHQARPDVLFSGQVDGMVYHLRDKGVSYQLFRTDNSTDHNEEQNPFGMEEKLLEAPGNFSCMAVTISMTST